MNGEEGSAIRDDKEQLQQQQHKKLWRIVIKTTKKICVKFAAVVAFHTR